MRDFSFSNLTQNIMDMSEKLAIQMKSSHIIACHLLHVLISRFPEWAPSGQLSKWQLALEKEIKKSEIPGGNLHPIFDSSVHRTISLADEIRMQERCYHIHPEHLWKAMIEDENHVINIDEILQQEHSENSKSERDNLLGNTENKSLEKSNISNFFINFSRLAKLNLLEPVIGRENEIQQVIRILLKRKKNNPLLLGEAGVGKTAIVEGIAQKLVSAEDIPFLQPLKNREILGLDLMGLIGGTSLRGELEKRLHELITELEKNSRHYILFIDEVHNLIGAGKSEGSADIANYLKPALARGEICVIGATTFAEYKRFIEPDSALKRRFEPITIPEPTVEETYKILTKIKSSYEKFHNVIYEESVLEKIPIWAKNYFGETRCPDNAINLMDNLGAFTSQHSNIAPAIDMESRKISKNLKTSINSIHNFETVSSNSKTSVSTSPIIPVSVTIHMAADFIEHVRKIDRTCILQETNERITNLKKTLEPYLRGQEKTLEELTHSLAPLGLPGYPRKKVTSIMLIGENDSGIVNISNKLAEYLYPINSQIYTLDLASYIDRESLYTLIGPPRGIEGFQDGGSLTEFVKHNPQCCLLLSNIEHCHSSVLRIFLEPLRQGIITDSARISYPFHQAMIIALTNSIEVLQNTHGYEFSDLILHKIRLYEPDTNSTSLFIQDAMNELATTFENMGYILSISENVSIWIKKNLEEKNIGILSYQKLQDNVKLQIEDPLAFYILENKLSPGKIAICIENGNLKIDAEK